MDLQTYLLEKMKTDRREKFLQSGQLSLGEMIDKCEAILTEYSADALDYVQFDFENIFPTGIGSWRGIYAELALSFACNEYQGDKHMSLRDFIIMLKGCIGKTFEGYKGGEFIMDRNTPVWVANYGNSGNTAVVDIIYDGCFAVIIMTGYREA